ncbi:flavin reductase [Pokkaliibacter plantistimulans]|uniref:Flavin reductase n=1 Tax=Pokkaliibacter plantistimulans TaxID=1635171 RepID=A0ABX5M240_9GAMM|nr:flavin reductase [Pokkaliibacter plantistimulans]PXF31573.1 flavin reductase [Pokkaliibacter plantistimulans]
MIDSQQFRNGMALLGGAVSVITTDGEAGRFGFTASAVCSVTDNPPTLLVCMNRSSYANAHFKANKVLCVNVLTGAHQGLSGDFANRDMTSDERFASHGWSTLETGAPALDEALVNFDCRISDIHEIGSHTVFYCQIADIRLSGTDHGLVYFNRAYHCLGQTQQCVAKG